MLRLGAGALVVFVLAGYAAALVPFRRGLADLAQFPRSLWPHSGYRSRHSWRRRIVLSYLLAGWPAFVVVTAWWNSKQRATLVDEWAFYRAEHEQAAAVSSAPEPKDGDFVTPSDEPVIDHTGDAGNPADSGNPAEHHPGGADLRR